MGLNQQSENDAAKKSMVERFMHATDKLRFFLGPADRDYDDNRDTPVESKTTSVKSPKKP